MLKLIASLSPVVALLIGAVPALAIGWGAREAVFQWNDRPAIIREATATADAACAIRTMDAANRAEQATRARQQAANAEALRIYRDALDASKQATLAAQSQLELETSTYAAQLAEEGRSCPWTASDLDERNQRLHQSGTSGTN